VNAGCYRILITGLSGSGKSFFAEKLSALGYPAYDADKIYKLSGWFDANGQRHEPPKLLTESFLLGRRFLWSEPVLKTFLEAHRRVLLFGIAHNSKQLSDYFDQIGVLVVESEQVVRNLGQPSSDNAFGKNSQHQVMARADTEAYYHHIPGSWLRLEAREPELLTEELSQKVGFVIPKDRAA